MSTAVKVLNFLVRLGGPSLFHAANKMEVRPSLFVGFLGAVFTYFVILIYLPSAESEGYRWSLIGGFLGGFLFFGGGFLWLGLRLVPVGFRALAVFMGMQKLDKYFEAGWRWYWPSPFGGMLEVDCQNKNLDIPEKKVLTSDKVPADIATSVAYNRGPGRDEKDPEKIAQWLYNYVITQTAEEQLSQETEDQLRIAVGQIPMEELVSRKEELTERIERGRARRAPVDGEEAPKDAPPEALKKGIRADVEKFGIYVQSLQITNIRFPKEIEDANAKKLQEEAERIAESTERDGNLDAIDAYIKRGMTASEAAVVHQAERKKVTRTVQTVQGIDLEGLGRGLGTGIAAIMAARTGGQPPRQRKRSRKRTQIQPPAKPQN